jgi:hypothetical protein
MVKKGKHPHSALSAARVRTEKRPGVYADGNGLYLQVTPPAPGDGSSASSSTAAAASSAWEGGPRFPGRSPPSGRPQPRHSPRRWRSPGREAPPVHANLRRGRREGDRLPPPHLEERQARRAVGIDPQRLRLPRRRLPPRGRDHQLRRTARPDPDLELQGRDRPAPSSIGPSPRTTAPTTPPAPSPQPCPGCATLPSTTPR